MKGGDVEGRSGFLSSEACSSVKQEVREGSEDQTGLTRLYLGAN